MREPLPNESCYHSLVFTEKSLPRIREFESSIKRKLESRLGNSVHVEYIYNIGSKINNIDFCLVYIEKNFGTLGSSSTLGINTREIQDQKTLIISWKNKNWLKNRIFSTN